LFNSKLNDFDKNLNLNLNRKWLSPTLEKTDMVLIYGETHGNSELARQITVEGFLEGYFSQCSNA
jgi:hypothetical protein